MMMRNSFVWVGVTAMVMLSGVAQRQGVAQASGGVAELDGPRC